MTKTTLTLGEIYQLNRELVGYIEPQTGEKILDGLLKQKMNLDTKFWLLRLHAQVADVVKTIEDLKNEYVKKYGVENEDGSVTLKPVITEELEGEKVVKPNPAFEEFSKEFNTLLAETKELEHFKFKPEDFKKAETEDIYPVLSEKIVQP